jgi:methanogenic corrinoid protein MtbC1
VLLSVVTTTIPHFRDHLNSGTPLSGFLTVAFEAMKETIGAIEKAGLRDQVKIMIGGGMVDEHIRAYTGADAYGHDAMEAVSLVENWIGRD